MLQIKEDRYDRYFNFCIFENLKYSWFVCEAELHQKQEQKDFKSSLSLEDSKTPLLQNYTVLAFI